MFNQWNKFYGIDAYGEVMERSANKITISVFAKPEEDAAAIAHCLVDFTEIQEINENENEKGRLFVRKTNATGFNERKIVIMEVVLEKNRHIQQFLKKILSMLTDEQKGLIIRQLESRLDDDFNFFLRFDKEKLLAGERWITDNGNCFHVKINIACFPRKRAAALEKVKQIFK